MQKNSLNVICPVCKTPAPEDTLYMCIANSTQKITGELIKFPVKVCPNDGIVFCVEP